MCLTESLKKLKQNFVKKLIVKHELKFYKVAQLFFVSVSLARMRGLRELFLQKSSALFTHLRTM